MDGQTDRRTDGRMDGRTDRQTNPLIEMLGASKNDTTVIAVLFVIIYGITRLTSYMTFTVKGNWWSQKQRKNKAMD